MINRGVARKFWKGVRIWKWNTSGIPLQTETTLTQNVPLGINIKNEQCVHLSSWSLHTAVHAAYERSVVLLYYWD